MEETLTKNISPLFLIFQTLYSYGTNELHKSSMLLKTEELERLHFTKGKSTRNEGFCFL